MDDATANDGTTEAPEGIAAGPVTAWLAERTDVAGPLHFELITGGHSNLTYLVVDADGRRWVLRRPPLGQVLATAHDMAREARIIGALGPTDVPVPPVVGVCTDEAVNGAPFYVMDYVDGTVVRDLAAAERFSVEARRTAGTALVEVLARIHAVDVDSVGLGDLSRREGYIERQLKRWHGQFQKSAGRDLPVVDEVHARLAASIPEQGPATIVHGDYRLDNCMLGPDGDVVAVLDWEICTLGDPLADLGLLMVYWADPDDSGPGGMLGATVAEGFPRRPQLLEHYAAVSGRDLSAIDFYTAFGYWKLACILEGVYARYTGGSMGSRDPSAFDAFGEQVVALAEQARSITDRL
ncbi:MAG: phosphotransferase family protein [Acidimicrobiia bacterium]|nr:phosphotransferase family protein [Acidimicrobiia bacterium]